MCFTIFLEMFLNFILFFFFFQAEDGIRDLIVTGVQTCALPISAVAVTEVEIADSMRSVGVAEGMLVCPEGGAAIAGTAKLRRDGWIREDEEVVIFNTGTGLKYAEFLQGEGARHLAANGLPDE